MQEIKLDFIGSGAPRCGTTKLSRGLAEHPEICFSERKELHYFNFDHIYNQGQGYLSRFFTHCQNKKIRGEWSTDYLYSKKAAERIKSHNPKVKILISLRHPVDRAYSHYLLQKYSGSIMPWQTFNSAIAGNDKYNYLKLGLYAAPLKDYMRIFLGEQMHIIIYEEFIDDPASTFKQLYQFLGVNPDFVPHSLNENVDYRARKKFHSLILVAITNKLTLIYKQSRFKKLWRVFRLRNFLRWLKKINRQTAPQKFNKLPLDQQARVRLQKFYESEITAVEKIIGRPLPAWKQ